MKNPVIEFLTTIEQGKHNASQVLVAPDGVDKYPKFLIHFRGVIAFTCMEKANAPQLIFDANLKTKIESHLSAYQHTDSPFCKYIVCYINDPFEMPIRPNKYKLYVKNNSLNFLLRSNQRQLNIL